MKYERVQDILNNKEKIDIYYNDRPVWIQCIDNFEEKDVFIEDLYE